MTERETYSLLEWLGDIGGLFDALILIAGAIVAPVASFNMNSVLLSSIFRYVSSLNTAEPDLSQLDK